MSDRTLSRFVSGAAGVGALGLVAAFLLPTSPEGRWAAGVGVSTATLSSGLALMLKRRAVQRSLQWALLMVGVVFGIRMVLVALGVAWAAGMHFPEIAFVVGFFGVYFVLQWIEVGYVLAEVKRRGRGGV